MGGVPRLSHHRPGRPGRRHHRLHCPAIEKRLGPGCAKSGSGTERRVDRPGTWRPDCRPLGGPLRAQGGVAVQRPAVRPLDTGLGLFTQPGSPGRVALSDRPGPGRSHAQCQHPGQRVCPGTQPLAAHYPGILRLLPGRGGRWFRQRLDDSEPGLAQCLGIRWGVAADGPAVAVLAPARIGDVPGQQRGGPQAHSGHCPSPGT